MATSDAEMPDHKALKEDLQEIAEHIEALRSNLDALAQSVGATGTHQAEALKAQAGEALSTVEDAVRREPLKSVSIAFGVGFLLGSWWAARASALLMAHQHGDVGLAQHVKGRATENPFAPAPMAIGPHNQEDPAAGHLK